MRGGSLALLLLLEVAILASGYIVNAITPSVWVWVGTLALCVVGVLVHIAWPRIKRRRPSRKSRRGVSKASAVKQIEQLRFARLLLKIEAMVEALDPLGSQWGMLDPAFPRKLDTLRADLLVLHIPQPTNEADSHVWYSYLQVLAAFCRNADLEEARRFAREFVEQQASRSHCPPQPAGQ